MKEICEHGVTSPKLCYKCIHESGSCPCHTYTKDCCEKCKNKQMNYTDGSSICCNKSCMCHTPTTKPYIEKVVAYFGGKLRAYDVPENRIEVICDELRDELCSVLEKRDEEIRGKIKNMKYVDTVLGFSLPTEFRRHNQIIDDILSFLQ